MRPAYLAFATMSPFMSNIPLPDGGAQLGVFGNSSEHDSTISLVNQRPGRKITDLIGWLRNTTIIGRQQPILHFARSDTTGLHRRIDSDHYPCMGIIVTSV